MNVGGGANIFNLAPNHARSHVSAGLFRDLFFDNFYASTKDTNYLKTINETYNFIGG